MYPCKQSTALDVVFFAFDSNGDGVTGKVDGDFTKRISKNGAAFAAMTVTITERENGFYHAQLSTSHTDTLGVLTTSFSATGIKRVNLQFRVHARLPDDHATQTSVDGVQSDTDDIQARLPTSLVSGRIDASVGAMANDVVTQAAIASGAIGSSELGASAITEIRSIATGTADSGSTTTIVDAERTEADTDYWKGCYVLFTSGSINGQVRLITGFTPASDTITFSPATTQAVGTNTYEIIFGGRADLELVKGSVINSLISGRVDANAQVVGDKVGYSVGSGGITASSFAAGAIDAAAIATGAIDADAIAPDAIGASEFAADAVAEIVNALWDELTTEGRAANSFGQLLKDNLNATISSRASQASVDGVQADTDNIQTRLPAALVSGRMDSSVGAMANDVMTAAAQATDLGTENANAVLDQTDSIETGLTLRQALRLIVAASAGKLSGAATTTVTIRNVGDSKNRITATVDASGNRSAVTTDVT